MNRYCHKTHTPGCPICERCESDPAFAAAVARIPANAKPVPLQMSRVTEAKEKARRISERFSLPPCIFLGGNTGDTVPCPACNAVVRVPVMECTVHGRCTKDRLVMGLSCCRICDDRIEEIKE